MSSNSSSKVTDHLWTGPAFRAARAAAYLFFAIAALVTIFAPSNIIFGIFSKLTFFVYFWSVLLLIGSVISLIGIIQRKWVGEYIGLPGIIACLLLYSAGCFLDTPAITVQRIFLGFIFLAFTALAYSRKKEVNFQRRVSIYENRVNKGLPGV